MIPKEYRTDIALVKAFKIISKRIKEINERIKGEDKE